MFHFRIRFRSPKWIKRDRCGRFVSSISPIIESLSILLNMGQCTFVDFATRKKTRINQRFYVVIYIVKILKCYYFKRCTLFGIWIKFGTVFWLDPFWTVFKINEWFCLWHDVNCCFIYSPHFNRNSLKLPHLDCVVLIHKSFHGADVSRIVLSRSLLEN